MKYYLTVIDNINKMVQNIHKDGDNSVSIDCGWSTFHIQSDHKLMLD